MAEQDIARPILPKPAAVRTAMAKLIEPRLECLAGRARSDPT